MKTRLALLLIAPLLSGCAGLSYDQTSSLMTPEEYANMDRPVEIPPPPRYYVTQTPPQDVQEVQPAVPAPPYYAAQPSYPPPTYYQQTPVYQQQYQPQYQPQYQTVTRSRVVCQSVVGNTLSGAAMGAGLGTIIGAIVGGHHPLMRGAWIGAASGGGLGAIQQPQCHQVYYNEQVPY